MATMLAVTHHRYRHTRRVARTKHTCSWGHCPRVRVIAPSDVYVESIEFPGADSGYATQAGHPVRMALCAPCAVSFGYEVDIPYEQLVRQGLL